MNTKEIGLRIRQLRHDNHLTQEQLAHKLEYSSGTMIARVEQGTRSLPLSKIAECAKILNTTTQYLLNGDDENMGNLNCIQIDLQKVFPVPIYSSVSAGCGACANDEIEGYEMMIVDNPMEVDEIMCIRVKGDSMEPKIEDGDLIYVHKQTSVDSGDIAVLLIEETDGVVKKVIYGPDWIELHSFNSKYPVRRFEKADILKLRVVGKVKKIIKRL